MRTPYDLNEPGHYTDAVLARYAAGEMNNMEEEVSGQKDLFYVIRKKGTDFYSVLNSKEDKLPSDWERAD